MVGFDFFKTWEQDSRNVFYHLMDDESKLLFELKNQMLIEPNTEWWIERILELYNDWRPEKILYDNRRSIVIYGNGHDGKFIMRMLEKFNIIPKCMAQTFRVVTIDDKYSDIKVKCIDELIKDDENLYVIASDRYRHEMYWHLLNNGVPKERIYIPEFRYPMAVRGEQYFDLFQPKDNEIFVDAGAYDGNTTDLYLKWAGSKVKGGYVIEPDASMCEKMQNRFANNIAIIQGGAWDKNEIIFFNAMGPATHIETKGDMSVKGIRIDELIEKGTPTFIKMDIEGAELSALKGAVDVIKKNKPRLAICVYHKPNDIVEIGQFVLNLVPDYKLWLRHYTSSVHETVLYASL